jgi:hypothetical protein
LFCGFSRWEKIANPCGKEQRVDITVLLYLKIPGRLTEEHIFMHEGSTRTHSSNDVHSIDLRNPMDPKYIKKDQLWT